MTIPGAKAACASGTLRARGIDAYVADPMAFIVSDSDGKIVACNAGAAVIFGYTEDELVGHSVVRLQQRFRPEPQRVSPHVSHVSFRDSHRWYRSKSGRPICGRTDIIALDHLQAGASAWFIQDVASQTWASPAPAHLCPFEPVHGIHIDGRDERDLALISHELKQPLTALMIQLEQLLDMARAAGGPDIADAARTIRNTVRRQARLVDDLFELSRARTGKLKLNLELVDLDHIVQDICAETALVAPTQPLCVNIERDGARLCMADAVRLEQIFSNLLHNAVKFSDARGRIDVRVSSVDGFAEVVVADDGLGISAEFLPMVFQPFDQEGRTADAVNAGLGIGLALVHELTLAHGGSVEVQSKGPGYGARFTIRLPLVDRSTPSRPTTGECTSERLAMDISLKAQV